jgi:hypothetical protein
MRNFLFLLTIISFLLACKSAQDKFKDQDYVGAFESAIKGLKKKNDTKQNLAILKKSLTKIISAYQDDLKTYPTLIDLKQKAKVADSSIDLVEKIDKAKQYIEIDSFINHKELINQNSRLKTEVGTAYLNSAQTQLNEIKSTHKKTNAHQALDDAMKAQKYIGKSPESLKCIDEIEEYGTVVVNVEVQHWNDFSSFDVNKEFRNVENNSSGIKLIKYLYDSSKALNKIDCNIEVRLSSIDYDESIEQRSQSFTEKVPDGFEIVKDDEGNETKVQLYKEVTGTVTIKKTIIKASCDVNTNIDDYEGNCSLSEERWSEEIETYKEMYELSGDERAIPDEYTRQPSNSMKSESELAEELLSEIYDTFARKYF